MTAKEKFTQMVVDAGYPNIHKFSFACEIAQANIQANFNGTQRPSILRMFTYANNLGVPVEKVIEVFYEEEMKENLSACKHS